MMTDESAVRVESRTLCWRATRRSWRRGTTPPPSLDPCVHFFSTCRAVQYSTVRYGADRQETVRDRRACARDLWRRVCSLFMGAAWAGQLRRAHVTCLHMHIAHKVHVYGLHIHMAVFCVMCFARAAWFPRRRTPCNTLYGFTNKVKNVSLTLSL